MRIYKLALITLTAIFFKLYSFEVYAALDEGSYNNPANITKSHKLHNLVGKTKKQILAQVSTQATKVFNLAINSKIQTLNPIKVTSADSSRISSLIYHSLIRFDANYKAQAALGTIQKLDKLTYEIVLKKDLKFTYFNSQETLISKPLQAVDVAATYNFVLDKTNLSPHRTSLANIKKIKVLDEYTLLFRLQKPDPLFISRLSIGIVPASQLQNKNQNLTKNFHPIGSSDFIFIKLDEKKLSLLRLRDSALFNFYFIRSPVTAILKLINKEVDIVTGSLEPELLAYAKDNKQICINSTKGSNFSYIAFNFKGVTSNRNLRLAISHALDKKLIIAKIFRQNASLANHVLPATHWVHDLTASAPIVDDFDPEQAVKYIQLYRQQMNLPINAIINLSFLSSNKPLSIRLATIYQAELKKLGINLQIKILDWGSFFDQISNGNFDLFSLSWVGIKSPDIFEYIFATTAIPPQGANRGFYANPKVDALIQSAKATFDYQEQAKIYREIEAEISADKVYIPLWYQDEYFLTNCKIQNLEVFSDGRFDGFVDITKTVK